MSNLHYPNGDAGNILGSAGVRRSRGLLGADDPLAPFLFLAQRIKMAGEPEPTPTTSSLSGYVYEDRYSLGLRSPHFPGVGDVRLTLEGVSSDGRPASVSCRTNADGRFLLSNVPAGVYSLHCTIPTGFLKGWVTVGRVESRAVGTILSDSSVGDVALAAGDFAVEYNFGLVRPVSLSGRAPVGVRVVLNGINDCGQSVRREARSGEDGSYSFTDLRPGIYDLRPEGRAGWLLVGRVRGSFTGWPEEGNRVVGITLRSGDEGLGYDVQPTPPPGP